MTADRHALAHQLRQINEHSRAAQHLEATDPAIVRVKMAEGEALVNGQAAQDGAGAKRGDRRGGCRC